MRRIVFLLFLYCCTAASLYAQQRLSLPDTDAIGYDEDGYWIKVYTKVGNDRYVRRYLRKELKKVSLDETSEMGMIGWNLSSVEDTLSRSDIEKEGQRLVYADSLRSISLEDYVGKTFDINEDGKWKRNEVNSNYVLKFLRSDLAFVQQLRYTDTKEYDYDNSTTSTFVPDSVTTWRTKNSEPLLPLVLELKGGKNVLLFSYRSFNYLLLPTIKSDLFVKFFRRHQPAELTAAGSKYDAAAPYDFWYFNIKDFFGVKETVAGRCRLLNAFGENVLKQDYDNIVYVGRFIVAKTGNSVDVYNLYLEKLDLGTIMAAYEIPNCIIGCVNVLNRNGAFYYDEMGKKMKNPWKIRLGVCGTVPVWTYSLLKKRGQHQLKYYTDGPGVTCEEDKRYVLSDCQPSDSLTFLDGEKKYSCNGNSWILSDIDVCPEWIRVERNGKFGILAYDYQQPNNVKPKKGTKNYGDWKRPLEIYPVRILKGKTILPMVYDSIILRNDEFIYFYKDGKVGLFPRDKAPVYDELEQKTRYFYHIVKNGVSGWLDIKTDEEYYFPSLRQ
ncbi:hypothetical protein CTM53_07395 [Prevotella intermedia]|jgi:hypothetical protein|uniref:WG repeat-containing protein n=1 Tax=Prevotella intermedia TaxID=28131 RepID=A0AAJ3RT98_PREIN|nr:hypothetical protein [Prevotella intermedia]ATV54343.1 hypothetical protein CTM61_02225 [Prevotella intermedia]PJI20654.1 hypothetical protein CTM53_07395 [Prevotella intermedia]